MTDVKLLVLLSNTWNHLTVCKKEAWARSQNVIQKMFLQIIYIWLRYKQNLALNKLQ